MKQPPPFLSVYVRVDTRHFRHVIWSLDPVFQYPQGCVLSVEYNRAGGSDLTHIPQDGWTTLQDNITDQCEFIDYQRRNHNKYINDYYRVVLHVPDTGKVYKSAPVHAGYCFHKDIKDSQAQVDNLIRLTQLQIQSTGRSGILLKKKVYGARCPDCTHFDDQNPVNEHCPTCLGTGIIGGYYKGIPMGILQQGAQQQDAVTPYGYMQAQKMAAKCVAWPWIHLGDVWADAVTGQRYYISGATVLSKYRGVPLVYRLTMNLLELSDVLHSQYADTMLSQQTTSQPVQQNTDWTLEDNF